MGFGNPVTLGPQTVPMNQNGYMAFKRVDYNPSLVANPYFPADVGPTLYFPPQAGWFAYAKAAVVLLCPCLRLPRGGRT